MSVGEIRPVLQSGCSNADVQAALASLPAPRSVAAEVPIADLQQLRSDGFVEERVQASRWQRQYVNRVVAVDLQVGLAAGLAAYLLRFGEVPAVNWPYLVAAIALSAGWCVALLMGRAYETRFLFAGGEEYRRVLNSAIFLTAFIAILAYCTNTAFARGYVLLSMPLLLSLDLGARHLLRMALTRQRRRGLCMHRAVVLGTSRQVQVFAQQLRREPYHGMSVVGCCLPVGVAVGDSDVVDVPVYGAFDDVLRAIIDADADTLIVLPSPDIDPAAMRALSWDLEGTGVDLILANALLDVTGPRTSIRPVDGLPLLHVEPASLTGARRVVKRIFDVVVSGLLLVCASPMLLAVALAVRLSSKGPALFMQTRVGKDGREFRLYKFRSMYLDAEERLAELQHQNEHNGILFKIRDDPRVTKLGKHLRRFSIDELPQLINVLKGDMSLVGPRPPLPREVAQYAHDVRRRLAVIPGLTGLWQVSGRSNLSWEDSVRLDLRYVENWSLSFDLVILLRTFVAVVRSSGAY
ncbi:sugar transferase [Cryptosporangium arvum]|uniref:sugar transferase n=1 Tax=Cryptosporangium arvum TaxID=80871 RepID=UPI0004B898FB|nr:sugar transferase [Cryptosporangium arvum]